MDEERWTSNFDPLIDHRPSSIDYPIALLNKE
jgi:hypothetical protein